MFISVNACWHTAQIPAPLCRARAFAVGCPHPNSPSRNWEATMLSLSFREPIVALSSFHQLTASPHPDMSCPSLSCLCFEYL